MITEHQTIEIHDWGIHVRIKEGITITNDDLGERVEYIINLCKDKGKNRLLNEVSLSNIEASVGALAMATERMAQLMGSDFRFAMVSPSMHDTDTASQHEHMGEKVGIQIRYFRCPIQAKEWLAQP